MSFEAFLDSAWSDHADRPQAVADRLVASLDLPATPDDVVQLVRLAAHVFGEHLGQWQRGIDVLETVRALPAAQNAPAVDTSVRRAVSTLRYASGDEASLDTLSSEERTLVLAGAGQALVGHRESERGIAAFEAALELAERGLPAGSPAIRALAAGGNNIAATLEERPDRTPAETEMMVTAAKAGLRYWKQAGTWLEEERAHHRLARSLLAARRPHEAVTAAEACLHVCTCNSAPAFERFFAHAALAIAHRDAGDAAAHETARADALSALEDVPEEERAWCAQARAELDG